MLSMFKMNIRRMLKSKSFYLAIIFFVLISSYCIYSQAKWQVIEGYVKTDPLPLDAGLYSIVNYYLNSPLQLMFTFTLKNGLIIFGIYIVSFVASDDQSGFIKNSCMMCKHKSSIIWVKLYMTVMLSVLAVILSFLLTTILGSLWIDDFTIGSLKDMFMFSGLVILLYVAFFSSITFVYKLIGSKLPSILLCVFFSLGLTMVLLEPILGESVKYTLSGVFLNFPNQFQDHASILVIIVCMAYLVISHIASIVLFQKRDI